MIWATTINAKVCVYVFLLLYYAKLVAGIAMKFETGLDYTGYVLIHFLKCLQILHMPVICIEE